MPTSSHSLTPAKERTVLLALVGVQFTHILDFMIMMPLGPQLMRVFEITPAQFTHLVAAYAFAAAIAGFAGGFVLDRYDRKRALLIAYAGFGLATLACGLAPTHHLLLVARLAAGAFGGVAGSLVSAMVADIIPPARRGRAMSFVMSAFPIASVLGIPVGLELAGKFGWQAPFLFLAACAALNLVLGSIALPHLRTAVRDNHPFRQMREILAHGLHLRAFALGASLVLAGGCLIPFIATAMVTNYGLAEAQLSKVYAAGGVATLFSMIAIGRLSDRMDRMHLLAWLSAAAVAVVLVMTNLGRTSLAASCAIMALFMVTMSGRFAPAMTMVTNAVAARYRGGFMSVNSALQQGASALANLLAGIFVTRGPDGRLVGFPLLGLVSVGFFALTVVLAARLRSAAPHVARNLPAPPATATPAEAAA